MNDIQTHRHKMWVGIPENKNVGVYVYSPVFSHDVFEIPSFAIFIPQPRTPFYEQPQL